MIGSNLDETIADDWIRKGRAKWLAKFNAPAALEPMDKEKVRWLAGFTLKPERLGGFCGGVRDEAWGFDIPSRALPKDRPITAKEAEDSLWPSASRELALKFTYLFVTHPDEAAAFWAYARARWAKAIGDNQERAAVVAHRMHFFAHATGDTPPKAEEVAAEVRRLFGGKCSSEVAAKGIGRARKRQTRKE